MVDSSVLPDSKTRSNSLALNIHSFAWCIAIGSVLIVAVALEANTRRRLLEETESALRRDAEKVAVEFAGEVQRIADALEHLSLQSSSESRVKLEAAQPIARDHDPSATESADTNRGPAAPGVKRLDSSKLWDLVRERGGIYSPAHELSFVSNGETAGLPRIGVLPPAASDRPASHPGFELRLAISARDPMRNVDGSLVLTLDGGRLFDAIQARIDGSTEVALLDLHGTLLFSRTPDRDPKAPLAQSGGEELPFVWVEQRVPLDPRFPEHTLSLELARSRDVVLAPIRSSRPLFLIAGLASAALATACSGLLSRRLKTREDEKLRLLKSEVEQRQRLSKELRRAARTDRVTARVLRLHPDSAPLDQLLGTALEELLELPDIAHPGRMIVYLMPTSDSSSGSSGPLTELRLTAQRGSLPATQHASSVRIEELCVRAAHFSIPISEPGTPKHGAVRTPGAAVPLCVGSRTLGALYADLSHTRGNEAGATDLLGSACELLAQLIDRKLSADALQTSLKELEAARAAAIAGTRLKDEFLARVSHQLRTPLTSILGFAEFLRDEGGLDRDRAEAVEIILANGRHLQGMLAEFVDVSRIEAGTLPPERHAVNPASMLKSVARTLEMDAADLGLQLHIHADLPPELSIETDAGLLKAVLIRLASHSMSQVSSGGITLRARLERAHDRLYFEIFAGSAPEAGEPPTRSPDAGAAARAPATPQSVGDFGDESPLEGLPFELEGMSASLRTIGGRLRVIADPDSPGYIELALPLGRLGNASQGSIEREPASAQHGTGDASAATDEATAARPDLPLEGLRLLVAEDNDVNRMLVERILVSAGAIAVGATDGLAAVEAVMSANADHDPFDAILMDMHMPIMDGLQATQELRGRGFDSPILALTASDAASDHQLCLQAGCDSVEPKPVSRDGLVARILEATKRRRPI